MGRVGCALEKKMKEGGHGLLMAVTAVDYTDRHAFYPERGRVHGGGLSSHCACKAGGNRRWKMESRQAR